MVLGGVRTHSCQHTGRERLLQESMQAQAVSGRWGARDSSLVNMQGYHPQGQKLKKRFSVGRDESPFGGVAHNVDSGARLKSRDQKPVLLSRL